ncbi:hypothetical protein [Blastomonas fulva]|uniref:hypothetical protein n=1 Tax=Blastomonas fulva TaxID=1550728 RepID=UPI003F70DB7E
MVSQLVLPALLAIATMASPVEPAEKGALTAQQLASCQTLGADFARSGKVLKMYRAYKGADGQSHIETIDIEGKGGVYYGGKVSLTQFGFGDPSNVVIVYGHPDMEIPAHPSPYREIFLIISGSSVVTLADGTEYALTPGTMLLSEDQGTPGRGGRSGPCGYVAVDFQYKQPEGK